MCKVYGNEYSTNTAIYVLGETINVSGTWVNEVSYVIGGDVFVKGTDNPTLTINPNTKVKFARNTSLYIGGSGSNEKGKLVADGSLGINPGTITFTSDQATHTAGYWGCIFFDNYSDDESILDRVVVENGGYNYKSNIYCVSASPSIQNSIIGSSSAYGIRCNNSSPKITNDIIKDNLSHGIFLEGTSSPTITMSTITGNKMYGIYYNGTSSQPILRDNTIATNTTAMRITANTDFSTNTITGNINAKIEILGGNITNNKLWKNFNNSSSGTYTFVILGNIFVMGTDAPTLTIEPNIKIRFATNTFLIIGGTDVNSKGKLIADGSLGTNPGTISFTSDQAIHTAGYWGCIGFDNYSDNDSILDHVVVENGGYAYNANIYCISASPSIKNSLIIGTISQYGILLEGSSNPNITANTITGNKYGIYCKDIGPQPTILNNTIATNTTAMRITANTDFSTNTIYGNTNERIEILGGNITKDRCWNNFNDSSSGTYTFVILGTVSVKGANTPILTIKPNVTVRFATNTSLYIGGSGSNEKGKLIADGSLGTISFTSDGTTTAGYWGCIYFDYHSDDSSILDHVVVENGGYAYNANIYCISASPLIKNSIIRNSSGYGIGCKNSSPVIATCTIEGNSSHGIYLEGNSFPTIATTTITGNNYGIYCNDAIPQPVMQNNIIATNTTAMRVTLNTDFSTNTIIGNTNAKIEILGGNIANNKLWKNFNHSYIILGTVSVKGTSNPTLTIEPSVKVRFATNTSLYIGGSNINEKGKLIADGSWGTISFTSNQATHTAGYWGGIYFDKYSDGGSKLKNVVVEYGGYYSIANIYCYFASPSIQNSIIRNSLQHGIRCYNSSPQIINNTIKDNSSHGIYLQNNSNPFIATNTITNNNYGIYCAGADSSATITTNTITGNKSYPVRIGANSAHRISNNTYSGNNPNAIYLFGEIINTSGTWTNNGVPYVIGDDIFVKGTNTPTLTIEPNVEVRVTANTSLYIGSSSSNGKGKLIADGNLGTISFTSDQAIHTAGYWGCILFNNYSDDGSYLKNVVVEYAGGNTYKTNIFCVSSSPSIQNSIVRNSSGHGIRCNNSSSMIINNIINNNLFNGIYLETSSTSTITNNLILENGYSGIHCISSSPKVYNNIIVLNGTKSSGYYGIRAITSGTPIIDYNDVWGNGLTGTQSYSGCSKGVNDISANPQFIGGGDYHLQDTSPCKDKGLNTAPCIPLTDKDGRARIINGIVDMGAYEYGTVTTGTLIITSTPSGVTIYLDGANRGTVTPAILTGIILGTHTVKLTKSGYYPWTGSVTVTAETTTFVTATLTMMTCSISVTSTPAGATIYLDGTSTGTITPAVLTGIIPGTHTLKLTKDDYYDLFVSVSVTAEVITNIHATLILIAGVVGYISVISTPAGATIYLDGADRGTVTPAILTGIILGTHTVKLTKSGYHGWTDSVTVTAETTASVTATLTRITGSISITSTPSGATIYLDGTSTGTITTGIIPGTYTIKLIKDGYYDWFVSIPVTAEATTNIHATLTLTTGVVGSISVTSTPAGATIYLDGANRGTVTPAILTGIILGTHTVKLTKSGYHDWTGSVTVTAATTTFVTATLTLITGSISITSTPSGATIYLDGTSTGTITTDIIPGTYTIKLTKDGYYDWFVSIPVTAEVTTNIHATLTLTTVVVGYISVISTPAGATIYLDGADRGTVTPAILTGIILGTHTVKLTKSGYHGWTDSVTVMAGTTTDVYAILTETILTISPDIIEVGTENSFNVDVILSTATKFNAIGIYLSFDPNMLEVTKLTPIGSSSDFRILQSNNDSGTIDYIDTVCKTGTVLTISFKTKTTMGTAALSFNFNPPRKTEILNGINSIPFTITEGKVIIVPVPYGKLDGYVLFDIPRQNSHKGIEVTIDGTDLKAITNDSGYFLIEQVLPMIYQKISAYAPGASPRYWGNVTITARLKTTVATSTLLNADTNGDCMVNHWDIDFLKKAFLKISTARNWRDSGTWTRDGYINADFNGDDMVSLPDFGYLKFNFLKTISQQCSPLLALPLYNAPNMLSKGTATIKIIHSSQEIMIGTEFDMTIDLFHTPDFDSVGMYLSFDPQVLEVISLTPGSLTQGGSELVRQFNNGSGTIDYAIGLTSGTAQGTGTVLTIKLKAKKNRDNNPEF